MREALGLGLGLRIMIRGLEFRDGKQEEAGKSAFIQSYELQYIPSAHVMTSNSELRIIYNKLLFAKSMIRCCLLLAIRELI